MEWHTAICAVGIWRHDILLKPKLSLVLDSTLPPQDTPLPFQDYCTSDVVKTASDFYDTAGLKCITSEPNTPKRIANHYPNYKTKYKNNIKHQIWKTIQTKTKYKNNIQIKTGIFPGDVVLVEPAGDEVVVQRGQEATHLVQSLASSW